MSLFPAAPSPKNDDKRADLKLTLHFDGGSRGNPGPAGIGVVLLTEDGTSLYEVGEFLGVRTSNYSEYTALLRGLAAAKTFGATKLLIKADSELVVRQINGIYKVKSPDLQPLYAQARRLIDDIGNVTMTHVYREKNKRADELANEAMDKKAKIEPLGAPWAPGTPRPSLPAAARPSARASAAADADFDMPATNRGPQLQKLLDTCAVIRRTDEKLTVEQLDILLRIAMQPGISPMAIGDELKRSQGAVSRVVVDALIGRLALVYQDNRDAENVEDRLYLTETGERLVAQLLEALG
jgi:ribonuclease HI